MNQPTPPADLLAQLDALGVQLCKFYQAAAGHLQAQGESAKLQTPEAEMLYTQILTSEPGRWLSIGRTDLQTGLMALRRALTMTTEF